MLTIRKNHELFHKFPFEIIRTLVSFSIMQPLHVLWEPYAWNYIKPAAAYSHTAGLNRDIGGLTNSILDLLIRADKTYEFRFHCFLMFDYKGVIEKVRRLFTAETGEVNKLSGIKVAANPRLPFSDCL